MGSVSPASDFRRRLAAGLLILGGVFVVAWMQWGDWKPSSRAEWAGSGFDSCYLLHIDQLRADYATAPKTAEGLAKEATGPASDPRKARVVECDRLGGHLCGDDVVNDGISNGMPRPLAKTQLEHGAVDVHD